MVHAFILSFISILIKDLWGRTSDSTYIRDSGMKQEYSKVTRILSVQLLGEIERVKMCVQILKM